ncbi:DsbA family protein [Candidatus Absconditicoccus praedator]|uniref:DsbA family protein n=1 Tax=Candidatus Absconditicoccus praedator TaxID=2735562 RepID=UPI001E299553|nr:thioredoxin domain-containing protein [Candidatus Absconditicoccus praedator]UFX83220.1 thioredoxin domain-containing protein [Candidatus Absconditicoccus praedator]
MTKENNSGNAINIIAVVILVGVLTVAGNYFLLEYKANEIKSEVEKHHAYQFGGLENYQLAKQAFTSDQFIDEQRQQLEMFVGDDVQQDIEQDAQQDVGDDGIVDDEQAQDDVQLEEDDGFERGQLDSDQVEQVVDRGIIDGDPDAQVVWIEYSDVNCPFCQRQHIDGTSSNAMENFDANEVSYFYRNFPIFGDRSYPGSNAIECAGDLGGEDVYHDYMSSFYQLEDIENESGWIDLAEDFGIDTDQFEQCINSQEHNGFLEENIEEGQNLFGVEGTPGNVLLNTQTGDWVLVPGAYPSETFVSLIDDMLN